MREFRRLKDFVEFYNLNWDMTLREANTKVLNSTYTCPKCNGTGLIEHGEFGYNLDWVNCDLCNGVGRTKEKYKPITIVTGYSRE